jgi:hypothetical protein
MNNEKWEDYAIKAVKEQRDRKDLIASFFLCSAFVEHYCRTRLFTFLTTHRSVEIIKVKDKRTKKLRKVFIWSKMKKIIWNGMSQSKIIDVGLLVGAWNIELYDQLRKFNSERNDLVHEYKNLLQILEKDEKKVRSIIELGLSLLNDIKSGYVDRKKG